MRDNPEISKRLPLKDKMIDIRKISSNMIRKVLTPNNEINTFKILGTIDIAQKNQLGNLIKSLNNVKLKSILLRVIHGDVYCAARMKKFGMTDIDSCPRCGKEETIEHMIIMCEYTKKLWSLITKLTNIPLNSMKEVLGVNPTHDKTTLTINAELIRQLMAIERPTIDPHMLVQNTIKRLSIIEKGITKFQIIKFVDLLSNVPVTR